MNIVQTFSVRDQRLEENLVREVIERLQRGRASPHPRVLGLLLQPPSLQTRSPLGLADVLELHKHARLLELERAQCLRRGARG